MTGFLNPKSLGCQSCFKKWLFRMLIHRDAIWFLLKSVFGWLTISTELLKWGASENIGWTSIIVERLSAQLSSRFCGCTKIYVFTLGKRTLRRCWAWQPVINVLLGTRYNIYICIYTWYISMFRSTTCTVHTENRREVEVGVRNQSIDCLSYYTSSSRSPRLSIINECWCWSSNPRWVDLHLYFQHIRDVLR